MANIKELISDIDFEELFEYLKKIPNITKNIGIILFHAGWLIDFKISSENLAILAANKEIEKLNTILIDYFKKNLKSIENLTVEKFPKRATIIKRAFKAHKKEDYYVSITLFLTQIDGIFRDLSEKTVFSSRQNYNPISWIDQLKESGKSEMLISVLSPLQETELWSSDFKSADNYPNNLHRNSILHGYDIDYGNELNSYKAISMINYFTNVVYNIVHKNKIFDYE